MKKIGKYLREISVVVIGVAITLSVNNWIGNRNKEGTLARYLHMITTELEENRVNFDWCAEMLQKSVRYANYVQSHNEKSINRDSIRYYAHSQDGYGWRMIESGNIHRKNVFEMLKTSGIMQYVVDEELLISIWNTYSEMEGTQQFLDMCFEVKKGELQRDWDWEAGGKHIAIPMQRFYCEDYSFNMVLHCERMSKSIKETLSKLEKTK